MGENKLQLLLKQEKEKRIKEKDDGFYKEPESNEDEITMEDYFSTSLLDYDNFNDNSWNTGVGLVAPNYPLFSEYLEGVSSGLYLFAAESNHGKTALMTNIAYDIAMHEPNNAFMMYYSLDDSKQEIIPRLIAMDKSIPIGVAAKPQRYQIKIDNGEENSSVYMEQLRLRTEAIEDFKKNNNRFKIEDVTKIKTIEDMEKHFNNVNIYLKSINSDYKLFLVIDSINDLRFKNKKFSNQVEKHSEVARQVKIWAKEYDIPIFASIHLRKLNANRRPTLDDLKESTEYVYEASVVFLLFNDVSKNKGNANIYTLNTDGSKNPVIEIDWAKNKKSSFKGITFTSFAPHLSKAIEMDKESGKRFEAIIYGQ